MFQGTIANLLVSGVALGVGILIMEDYSGHGSMIRTVSGGALILAGLYYAINAVLGAGDP